jgi:hypothetical protein
MKHLTLAALASAPGVREWKVRRHSLAEFDQKLFQEDQ